MEKKFRAFLGPAWGEEADLPKQHLPKLATDSSPSAAPPSPALLSLGSSQPSYLTTAFGPAEDKSIRSVPTVLCDFLGDGPNIAEAPM